MEPTVISAQALENAIREHLRAGQPEALRQLLIKQGSADIADVMDRLNDAHQLALFRHLPEPLAAATLAEMGVETGRRLLRQLPPNHIGTLLAELPPDDAAMILTNTAPERQEQLLAQMESEAAAEVRGLLRYPKHSAGRLMTERFSRFSPEMTAGAILAQLRRSAPAVETITDLYIVEGEDRLVGVVSLRQLLLAPDELPVMDFMTKEIVSISPIEDQEVVPRLVSHYNLLALPVVEGGRILGIITVDDVIDVLIEESTEDQLRFGAVEPGLLNQPYFTTPLWRVVRGRVGWLLLLFLAETTTGTVLRHFEEELAQVVALSFFIPLLIGTGGNTGAQTVSTLIRGLAVKEIRLRDTWRVLMREFGSGLLLGLTLGVIAFFRAELWGSGFELSLVVALTIVVICTWANTIGALIPLAAQRFKVDPALVSAPLITTLVDTTGIAIYLLIARALLSQLQ